jgi:co-chaperonin GroES (HSP10)
MRDNSETGDKLNAMGIRVVLKKLELSHERDVGGIIIPAHTDANNRMTKGVVTSIGKYAYQENIEVGMEVLYDTMSVYQDKHPYVILDIQNVIVQIKDDEEIPLQPLGNNLLLQRINMDRNIGGIILPNDNDKKEETYRRQYKYKILKLGLGKVINGVKQPFEVEVGQCILNNKEVDLSFTTIDYKGKEYFMLDASNVIAIVED